MPQRVPSAIRRLNRLRGRLRKVDNNLIRLIRRRTELARHVASAKAAAGLPIRDYTVEAEVLRRAEAASRRRGLDPSITMPVFRSLIESSVAVQSGVRGRVHRPPGGGRRVLVAGGCGRMGAWLASFLSSQGHEVAVNDVRAPPEGFPFRFEKDLDAAATRCDFVAVAASLSECGRLVERAARSGGEAAVFDIASIKEPVLPALRAAANAGRRVASLHPMFGPDVALLSGRTLLACDTGDRKAMEETLSLFRGTLLNIVEVPLEKHDELMAFVLGMSHAVNLLFASALARGAPPVSGLKKAASATFTKQAATASEVAGENPALYYEIQHLNPHSKKVYGLIREALEELEAAAGEPSAARFVELMERGRKYFGGDQPPPQDI